MNSDAPAVVSASVGLRIATAVLLLGAACSNGDQVGSTTSPPRVESAAPIDPTPLLGSETDMTVVIAPGYGALYALDVDRGLAQAFPDTGGLPGDYPYRLVALDEGVAYPGGAGVLRLPWDLEGPGETLAASWIFIPSGRPGHLWLVGQRQYQGYGVPGEVREVDGAGVRTGRAGRIPGLGYPVAGVGDLVVLEAGPDLALFDPTRDVIERTLDADGFLAADGNLLAVHEGCACADVRVLDVEGGLDTHAELRRYPTAAALSPDGSRLALWTVAAGPDAGVLRLLDVETGSVERVAGSLAGRYADLVWSEDGRWVLALSRRDRPGETFLTGYRVGADRARTVATPSLQAGSVVAVPSAEVPLLDDDGSASRCPSQGGLDHNTNPMAAVTAGHPCRIRLD